MNKEKIDFLNDTESLLKRIETLKIIANPIEIKGRGVTISINLDISSNLLQFFKGIVAEEKDKEDTRFASLLNMGLDLVESQKQIISLLEAYISNELFFSIPEELEKKGEKWGGKY